MNIHFGALCDSLKDQLTEQQLAAGKVELKQWQRDADAITRLLLRGLIPESQGRKSRWKLMLTMRMRVKNLSAEVKR